MKKWKERRINCESKVRERITSENKETERKAKKNKEWKEYSERKAKRIKSGRTIVRERELKNRMNLKEKIKRKET